MSEPDPSAPFPAPGAIVAQLLALVAGYRLLVGSNEAAEWVAGALAAALGTIGTAAVARRLPPAWPSLVGVGKVLGQVPKLVVESVRVLGSALAPRVPAGTFAVVPVDPGGDDPGSAGRRGFIVAGVSLAPNSVVVTLDRDRGALLVHRLLDGDGSVRGRDQAPGRDPGWPL